MMNNDITSKITKELTEDGKNIRVRVFMAEQGFQDEFDHLDDIAYHLVIYVDGKPAACGRLIPSVKEAYIIGRVAVMKEYRSMKLGNYILNLLEKKAISEGAIRLELSAQCNAMTFYEKNGYKGEGDIYLDEHCPHIHMVKHII